MAETIDIPLGSIEIAPKAPDFLAGRIIVIENTVALDWLLISQLPGDVSAAIPGAPHDFVDDYVTYHNEAPSKASGEMYPFPPDFDFDKLEYYIMGHELAPQDDGTSVHLTVKIDVSHYRTVGSYRLCGLLLGQIMDEDGLSGDERGDYYSTGAMFFCSPPGWTDWRDWEIPIDHWPVGKRLFLGVFFMEYPYYGVPPGWVDPPSGVEPTEKVWISDKTLPDKTDIPSISFRAWPLWSNEFYMPLCRLDFRAFNDLVAKGVILKDVPRAAFDFTTHASGAEAVFFPNRMAGTEHILTGEQSSNIHLTTGWEIEETGYDCYQNFPVFVTSPQPSFNVTTPTSFDMTVSMLHAGIFKFAVQLQISDPYQEMDWPVEEIRIGTVENDVFTVLETVSAYHDYNLHLQVFPEEWLAYRLPVNAGTTVFRVEVEWVVNNAPLWTCAVVISDAYAVTQPDHGEVESMEFTAHFPSFSWQLRPDQYPVAQIIYTCTLPGANESPVVDDAVLPLSSFQAYRRNGVPSYLSCIIPYQIEIPDLIAARQNGEIIVKKGYRLIDGTYNEQEIVRASYDAVAHYKGTGSGSIDLSGYKTTTYNTPAERTVTGVTYENRQKDGKTVVRCDVDLFLNPGDTMDYGTGKIVAGIIRIMVTDSQAYMEVTEA